jgi:hypothetical protein
MFGPGPGEVAKIDDEPLIRSSLTGAMTVSDYFTEKVVP